jgi:hypothetical protein
MATSDGEPSPSLPVEDRPDSVLFEKWAIHFLSGEDVYTAANRCDARLYLCNSIPMILENHARNFISSELY